MLLTVSIVTKDRKDELKIVLSSLLSQDFDFNELEILIVDNNSNYKVNKVVDNVLKDRNIKYNLYIFKKNRGPAGGRNFSFLKSKAEYILFLDDDVIIKDSNFLKKIIDVMEENMKIGILQTGIYNPVYDDYQKPVYKNINKPFYPAFNFIGCSHMLRKNIFKDEDRLYLKNLIYRNEETSLALKVIDKGYKVIYYPEIEIVHRPSINRKSDQIIYSYNFVNGFSIKKIMYPIEYFPFISMVIFLRFLKNYGLSPSNIKKFFKMYKKRMNNSYKIQRSTAIKLIKDFGFINFISW